MATDRKGGKIKSCGNVRDVARLTNTTAKSRETHRWQKCKTELAAAAKRNKSSRMQGSIKSNISKQNRARKEKIFDK